MIVAAISSTNALFCRCFFFMPISTIARDANLDVNRSSTGFSGMAGNSFCNFTITARTSYWAAEPEPSPK